jgi:hypothetical protein
LIRQDVSEAMDIRTDRQAEQASSAAQGSAFNTISEGQSVVVRKNSAGAEVAKPRLNLIEGANITITLVDDPVNTEADITIAVSASPNVTSIKVGGNQIIGARKTGWTLPTSAQTRSNADYSTLTLAQLAEVVAALVNDLHADGGTQQKLLNT